METENCVSTHVLFASQDNHHHLEVYVDGDRRFAGSIDAQNAEYVLNGLMSEEQCGCVTLRPFALGLRTGWNVTIPGECAWIADAYKSAPLPKACELGRLLDLSQVSRCEKAHEEDGCWLYR